jgi:hypothetical protein
LPPGWKFVHGCREPVPQILVAGGNIPEDRRRVARAFKAHVVLDFGSILAYIEYNFLGAGQIGKINLQYPFADAHAPDGAGGNIPLSDFFQGSHRAFTTVMTVLPVSYFTNNPAGPQGPGDGGSED